VVKPQFIWADDFWQGLGTAYVCGQYVSVDSAGNLLPRRITAKGHLEPERRDNKVGFVDADGQFKISPVFDDGLPFSGGLAAVKVGEKWGFIDGTGSQVVPPKFDAAFYFRDGVAVAELPSGEVLIDTNGKTVASGYGIVNLISAGRVPASRDNKEGYLDTHGEVVVPFLYESVRSFSGNLAAVKQNGKWGYLDRDGRIVIPFEFDDAGQFGSGLAPARVGSKTGFIDKFGKFSFLLTYTYAPGFFASDKDGLFLAESDVSRFWTEDNRFGYVNKAGKVVWGPIDGSPDHPPLLGWTDEANSKSCEDIPETVRLKISMFTQSHPQSQHGGLYPNFSRRILPPARVDGIGDRRYRNCPILARSPARLDTHHLNRVSRRKFC
jgi:WG containing repeat